MACFQCLINNLQFICNVIFFSIYCPDNTVLFIHVLYCNIVIYSPSILLLSSLGMKNTHLPVKSLNKVDSAPLVGDVSTSVNTHSSHLKRLNQSNVFFYYHPFY